MENANPPAVIERSLVDREERLLTAREVAELLQIPRQRVYALDIPVVRISSRTLRWVRADVIAWRDKRRSAR